jgi:hypothetical protein
VGVIVGGRPRRHGVLMALLGFLQVANCRAQLPNLSVFA